MMYFVFLFLFFIQTSHSFLTQSPIWKTSIYFRAGQQNVINTLTGNDKTPNYTFTFSSALSGTPSIAYGIGKYQGIDYLMQEYFEIFRIGLTSTSFSVAVQITGSTSLYILRVPYLAIEPTFPHHLNTFDNIPVNYSAGNLVHLQNMKVNITSRSLASQTIYQNVINYTQQCGSRAYNKFSSTLQNYKITLLMTSLFVSTIKETSASQNYSMDLRMSYTIMNESFYQLKVRLKINVIVTRLGFSQIVFDATDIASSNKYKLIFEPWEVDNMGGTKQIPIQFKDNFIMAISQFTTPHGYCGFDYMWDWKENSTFFGVQIYESITRKGVCAFNRIISAVVYIQTWKCLSPYYYYNASTGLCQDECGLYFYGYNQMVDIELEYWCKPCQWGCSKCSHSNKCIQCNSNDMRVFNGSCYCPYGYLDTYIVTKCQPCVDPNCLICQKNANFNPTLPANDISMNASKNLCVLCVDSFYLNSTTKTCFSIPVCNSSLNQLLNYETYTCQQCQLEGCLQCRQTLQLKFNNTLMNVMQVGTRKRSLTSSTSYGIVTCALCDQNNQYFMNLTTKSCQSCQIDNCLQCSSLYTCLLCDSIEQYFLNKKTKQCEFCKVEGCEECINLTTCRKCGNIRGYFLDQETKSCTYCSMGCNECVLASNSLMSAYCRRCESDLFLINNRCFCPKGHYLTVLVNEQGSSCVTCDPVCKRCQNSSSQCTGCYFQQNRILSKNNTCECNATNYIEQLGQNICQKVDLSLCDMGYHLNKQTYLCEQICGDGVRIGVQCDDGNNIDRDGCSSSCRVETDFVCSNQMYELSECNYTGEVKVVRYNVSKSQYENVFVLRMRLQPQLVLYRKLLWKNRLRFQVQGSASIQLIQAVMVQSQILQVKGRYFENIKHLSIRLKFVNTDDVLSASSSWVKQSESESEFKFKSFYQSSQTALPLTRGQQWSKSLQSRAQTTIIERHLQSSSSSIRTIRQQQYFDMIITFTFIQVNIDFTHTIDSTQVIYYQQSVYKTARHLSSAFNIIIIIYVIILVPTLFFSKRVVTVLVVSLGLQLSYTSLISIPNINPLTYSMVNNLKYIYGVNNINVFDKYCTKDQSINSYDNYSSQYSTRLNQLGFSTSCLLRNMNLMVVFQIVAVIAILLLRLLQIKYKKVIKYMNVFKGALNNLVYFNLSNTVVSICMIDWNRINEYQIAIGTIQLVLTVIHMVVVFMDKRVYLIQVQIQDFIYNTQVQIQDFIYNIQKDKVKQQQQQQQQQDEEKDVDQQQQNRQQQQFQEEIIKQELYKSIKQQRDSTEQNTSSSNQSNTKIQLYDGTVTQDFRALLNPSNKQKQQGVNEQLLYFLLYTINMSIISPLLFVFLNTNTLINNLVSISLIIILITLQLILNPFKSSYQNYHSFTKLSTNYYLTYAFVILILVINLLFYLFQSVISQQQMQQKISIINLVAYFQIAVFLLFFAYFTVAQFYAVYFSFFQKQVLKSYRINQNYQKSSFKSQKNVNSTRLSQSQQNQLNHSMNKRYQYSINRNIIPKPLITSPNTKISSVKTKITKSSSKSKEIIFEIDEDQDQVQKYRF